MKIGGRGKQKREIFGSPTLGAHPSGLHPLELHLAGTFSRLGPPNWPKSKLAEVELAQVDRALEVWRLDMKLYYRFLDCIGG